MISFESQDLIEEVKQDIVEFGGNKIVAVWLKNYDVNKFIVNYDFIMEEMPITEKDVQENEEIVKMTLSALLLRLEQQNKLI